MIVAKQQCLLKYLDYDPGAIDGVSGQKTGDAIESFQRDNSLVHDRIFGPKTEEKARYNFNHDIFRPVQSNTFVTPSNAQTVTQNSTAGSVSEPTAANDGTYWARIKHYSRQEFRCPCGKCGGFPVEPVEELVLEADALREHLGVEVIVVPPDGHSGGSGVRCAAYNATFSNSASNSRHLTGRAMDFSARGVSTAKIREYLQSRKNAGKLNYWYQISDTAFHMDVP